MSFLSHVSVICFLASYAVAFGLEWTRLKKLTAVNRWVTILFAAAGLVAHTSYLFNRYNQTNLPPLLSSTHDWLLVLAWLGVLIYLFMSLADRDLPIGLFLLPIVLVLIGAASFVSDSPNTRILPRDPSEIEKLAIRSWAMLHASLLVFGIAGVLTGLTLSMMYLVQHRRLKHKQPGHSGLSFPNLERLARWNRWAVMVSVPLLTFGMATGVGLAIYSRKGPTPVSLWDPVIVMNGVVWFVMACLFAWLLRAEHPTGRKVAWFTLWACGFLMVIVLGLQIVAGGIHGLGSWHT